MIDDRTSESAEHRAPPGIKGQACREMFDFKKPDDNLRILCRYVLLVEQLAVKTFCECISNLGVPYNLGY